MIIFEKEEYIAVYRKVRINENWLIQKNLYTPVYRLMQNWLKVGSPASISLKKPLNCKKVEPTFQKKAQKVYTPVYRFSQSWLIGSKVAQKMSQLLSSIKRFWLNLKKAGSKNELILAQKVGSSPPYRGGEPMSHEPTFMVVSQYQHIPTYQHSRVELNLLIFYGVFLGVIL